jgi:hypothetical protein
MWAFYGHYEEIFRQKVLWHIEIRLHNIAAKTTLKYGREAWLFKTGGGGAPKDWKQHKWGYYWYYKAISPAKYRHQKTMFYLNIIISDNEDY